MEDFLKAPGMDWVRPDPLGGLARMEPGQARGMAGSMQRERLHRLQGDKVEAEIDRIHRLTQADLHGRSLSNAGSALELEHLRSKYPLLIEQLEQDIETGRAESDAKVGVLGAQAGTYDARAAQIGAETDADKRKAALELQYLERRYPGLLRQLDRQIENADDESEANVLATQALANARNAAAASTAAGAADDARREAEELRQLAGRYPGLLDLDEARVATEQGAAASNEALAHQRMVGAGVTAAGGAQDAMTAAIERGALPAQLAAELDATRALAEMRRARGQAAMGTFGGPSAMGGTPGTDPLNPYSTAANRYNDDVTSLVDDLYGPGVLADVVTGEPMIGIGPERERRKLEVIRAAQNLAAVSNAAGRPMSPQEAVTAAVEQLRGEGQPPAGGSAPGVGGMGGIVPAGPDPLGILGGV